MKKKLKGFTLVELIIVMALLVILFTMIAAMFKPISMMLSDVKGMDKNRTVVDGVNTYVCDMLKYSTSVEIFEGDTAEPSSSDINAFLTAAGLDPTLTADQKKVNILAIVNEPYGAFAGDTWRGVNFKGRVFRKIGASGTWFKALGTSFYSDLTLEFKMTKDPKILPTDPAYAANHTNDGQVAITTMAFDENGLNSFGNTVSGKQVVSASLSSNFLNKSSGGKYFNYTTGTGSNTYILFIPAQAK